MNIIINGLSVLIVLLLSSPTLANINSTTSDSGSLIRSTSELIDIAGQQRMLVHQVLVSYAQIGQTQSFGNPVNTKQAAIRDFEANLNVLKNDVRFAILSNKINELWLALKNIILKPPQKSSMPDLIEINEKIVKYSNRIIETLVANNQDNLSIIDIAGKQRMLSQRIALFMLVENWDLLENYKIEMQLSLARFAINMNIMKKNKDNTEEIDKRLESMERDFKKLIKIISNKTKDRDYSFSISRYTSQLLRKSKVNTKLYVELKNNRSASTSTIATK